MKPLSILILCLSCLIIVSCSKNKAYKKSSALAASINGEKILLSDIDSMVQKEIYNIRKWQLDILISDELLKKEAQKRNISKDSLLFIEVTSKAKEPKTEEVDRFMAENQNFAGNVSKAKQILYDIFKQERYKHFTDSLKHTNEVTIYLLPAYSKLIDTKELWGIKMNVTEANIDVYLIMNFECPSCFDAYGIYKDIVEKHNKQVNFKFIYLNSDYGMEGKALMAFANQNKALDLMDEIIVTPEAIHTDNFYVTALEKHNLSKSEFDQDINSEPLLHKLLQTRDALFKQGVYTTPSIIINGKLYEGEEIFKKLDQLIKSETSISSK
ncbi:MAG: thioredoxin domain-containing protein [Lentimicrobium sp.]|jgi:2-hydroxychromene-2-carboxylate isomerase|nr:thioredoxin domain-containing protein [Lentimicrobium sp.]